jgi:hypothetical protein
MKNQETKYMGITGETVKKMIKRCKGKMHINDRKGYKRAKTLNDARRRYVYGLEDEAP